ncbi:response regulator [Synechococcus sp. CBW1002]|uniref:response regulator n=1 Tax=Synechococcus sp. CBW1002 TaxID=1353134 RepID=UPI0018CE954F|nr:response regulator [Synechococcus sp. CBW1002]QPN61370.1 response regulator [Synechococcus sp. CBW1002]
MPLPTPPVPSERRIRREALLTGITIFSVAAAALTVTYRVATRTMQNQLREHLRSLASIAAAEIDTKAIAQLQRADQLGGPLYQQVSQPLIQLRSEVPEIYYAYTLRPSSEGLRFGVDTSYYVKNHGDDTDVAKLGELYTDALPAAKRALQQGTTQVSQTPYTDRWGTFLSSYAPFRNASGQVIGLVGLDLSTTQIEEKVLPLRITLILALVGSGGLAFLAGFDAYRSLKARAQALLEQTDARQLAEAAAAAADLANQAKTDFIATLSHEIRTPLNGVLGMTDLVLASELTDHQRECLDTVKSSGKTLLSVLNDILDFSKIEAGRLELEEQPCALRPLIEDVLDLYAPQVREKRIELVLLLAPEVPSVILTDPTRLRQILMNLVGNATKFTERGEIVVEVTSHGSLPEDHCKLEITVRDTGVGIPADRIARLFQAFSQADASTTRIHGGTGLGLVICRRLARALGGDISVTSTEGEGSVFSLTFRTQAIPLSDPLPQARLFEKRGVLIAMANPTNQRLLESHCRLLGMVPHAASTAGEVLGQLEKQTIEAVVLDTALPGEGISTLVTTLRERSERQPRPVIVIRWVGEEVDGSNVQAVLSKPIKPVALGQILMRSLEPPPTDGDGAAVASGPSPDQPVRGTMAESHPLRVLVADDNAVNRRVCELVLRRLGYTPSFAVDGEEAVTMQATEQPDLILMDLHMPRLDGLEATRRIRSSSGDPIHPWILAVTADVAPSTGRAALTDGINDFLSKPIETDALVAAIHHAYAVLHPGLDQARIDQA